jgi:hypothetical protein
MPELSKQELKDLLYLAELGASYDSDGCDYAVCEEKTNEDRRMMLTLRKLKSISDAAT